MTTSSNKLYLNLYWHMHQPDYRDTMTGQYILPWTYLHAIKDYTDMAYHLEMNPKARVTFNFVPILLDQLEAYAKQFAQAEIRDPLLAMLVRENLDYIAKADRCLIVDSCFKSHHEKMLEPFADYQRLHNIYKGLQAEGSTSYNYLSGQYMADLLVWYHLAWTGESIRRHHPLVQSLMKKGHQFSYADRLGLFQLIGDLITNLIPRYKALAQAGQIEISTTPHYHPILPLLMDFQCTRDAMPEAPLPSHDHYPGGIQRAMAQLESARVSHNQRFGTMPMGMWPAEGGVSFSALGLMAQQGIHWAATGEGVLANSLKKSRPDIDLPPRHEYLYKIYRLSNGNQHIHCFFRDDVLSDKIGFEYAKLHADDAVADFVSGLEHIYRQQSESETNALPIVSVILDGENAWEYFSYNAYYFLSQLYQALVDHPFIQMSTFSDCVAMAEAQKEGIPVGTLSDVAAGSWVYGTFSTWIGIAEKNLAWDLLCEAKNAYDKTMQTGRLSKEQRKDCERQLSICEGSDWFWWFGDYNSSVSVASFDQLYRLNLKNLYRLLGLSIPDILDVPISSGGGNPDVGGTMRRGQADD